MTAPEPRPLGRTGLHVSPLGFGAVKIGRTEKLRYPGTFTLPDDGAVARLLDGVLDLGINLLDTAPAYGVSEERIGKHLQGRRGDFVLSTKAGETFDGGVSRFDFSGPAIRGSLKRSLRRLRTDAVDVLLLHSDGDDLRVLQETDAVATLLDLKSAGLARAVGLSGKTVEGARAALEWADVLMVPLNAADRSHEAVAIEARSRGVGVMAKKALASGTLPADAALAWLAESRGVDTAVVGSLDVEHLRDNLRVMTHHRPAGPADVPPRHA